MLELPADGDLREGLVGGYDGEGVAEHVRRDAGRRDWLEARRLGDVVDVSDEDRDVVVRINTGATSGSSPLERWSEEVRLVSAESLEDFDRSRHGVDDGPGGRPSVRMLPLAASEDRACVTDRQATALDVLYLAVSHAGDGCDEDVRSSPKRRELDGERPRIEPVPPGSGRTVASADWRQQFGEATDDGSTTADEVTGVSLRRLHRPRVELRPRGPLEPGCG